MKINIATAVTDREIQELINLCYGKRVIEVGSLLGYSAVMLSQVATEVHAIDPHSGYPYYNPSPTLREFNHNIEKFGSNNIIPHVTTAQQILPKLTADITFIDCTGLYEDTKYCLTHGHGLRIVHDFN